MKLLKLRIDGAMLYRNDRFEIDFIATDRVPRDEEGNIFDVTPVSGGTAVYTQNVIGFAGINASGKTTGLNLIRMVLGYLTGSYVMRGFSVSSDCFGKLADRVTVTCIFVERGKFYLIESDIQHYLNMPDDPLATERRIADKFAFEDEELWELSPSKATRGAIADIDLFKSKADLLLKRNGQEDEDNVLDDARRTFLGDDMSIVSMVTGRKMASVEGLDRALPLIDMPTPVVQAFDTSVEYLKWDSENQVFHLKFRNESTERVLSAAMAKSVLSNGTIMGCELVQRSIETLHEGGYLIVDEMETGLNRSLVGTVIGLFASPATNPKGATLLFSTHYPELFDYLRRKDNVYILVRNENFKTEIVKYSNRIPRIENKKSDVIISNVIKGSMPKYPDVQAMRDYVCGRADE